MKKILLCITGSIAAYKSADLASRLIQKGFDVHVVMTQNSTSFITPMVFETLTRNKVFVKLFQEDDHTHLTHITSAQDADLILIAPATYNIIGKAARGIADDLLSSILAAASPNKVIFAPAMNVDMYNNPILMENIKLLSGKGCQFIEPDEGMLACGVAGKGRMRSIEDILEVIEGFFSEKPLSGKTILITAGATREYIDPIRFLSNSSSGMMGLSLARACRNMGGKVRLIMANSILNTWDVEIKRVNTVKEMYESALESYQDADIIFAAAAVSDYKPKCYSPNKIKKSDKEMVIPLEMNTDILYELGKLKTDQILIGFAAESENIIENAVEKLERKNLDFIIANDLGNFASSTGSVTVISRKNIVSFPEQSKEMLAVGIVQSVLKEILR